MHEEIAGAGRREPVVILHVIVDLGIGGAELALARLIESHAVSSGYRHLVVSLSRLGPVGAQLRERGVEVQALGLRGVFNLPAIFYRLVRILRAVKPDVVQCWMYHGDLVGGLAARAAGNRNILWGVRATLFDRNRGVSRFTSVIRGLCALLSSRVPSRIVYVAESARRLHEDFGYDRGKSRVIPNGYATPPAPSLRDRAFLRTALGLPADALIVGSVGRFTGLKDHHGFILACASVAASVPQARFVLVGTEVDEANEELTRWIQESGYADRFHLLGERKDVSACLVGMDVFCLHSIAEAFPNVLAEAMAVGLPSVSTDVGDAAAILADTGLVVPPRHAAELARAMRSILAATPGERAELGRRARERIAAHFSIDATRIRYESLYAEITGTQSSSVIRTQSGSRETPDQQALKRAEELRAW